MKNAKALAIRRVAGVLGFALRHAPRQHSQMLNAQMLLGYAGQKNANAPFQLYEANAMLLLVCKLTER